MRKLPGHHHVIARATFITGSRFFFFFFFFGFAYEIYFSIQNCLDQNLLKNFHPSNMHDNKISNTGNVAKRILLLNGEIARE